MHYWSKRNSIPLSLRLPKYSEYAGVTFTHFAIWNWSSKNGERGLKNTVKYLLINKIW